MKSRDVVGRRIVRVEQERFWNEQTGTFVSDVKYIELDNGTRIVFTVIETGSMYYGIDGQAIKVARTA